MTETLTRVLLVDDDPDVLVQVRDLLEDADRGAYEIDWVASCEEALQALDTGHCDVCLVDYYLGPKTAIELLAEARRRAGDAGENGGRQDLPFIVLTGRDARDIDLEVMEAGADDYLPKDGLTSALLERSIRYALAHKRIERELERRGAELERSNRELEQFAYTASHDLQEPLRMVACYAELLCKRYQDKLDGDAGEFMGYVVDGARRMQRLIDDLLAYSRVGTGGRPFARVACEAVLERALANLRLAITESGARVSHDPLPEVIGDEGQLVQLFQNLTANAIKFVGSEAPAVHVGARRRRGAWEFRVSDNGIGIDPHFAERIFVIFQRLHVRGRYPGTGMGLAIAKRIVERHGGRIWVESQPGRGATFRFTLPDRLAESAGERRGRAAAAPAPSVSPGVSEVACGGTSTSAARARRSAGSGHRAGRVAGDWSPRVGDDARGGTRSR